MPPSSCHSPSDQLCASARAASVRHEQPPSQGPRPRQLRRRTPPTAGLDRGTAIGDTRQPEIPEAAMQSGRNVDPEWGHVAPASSLRRVLGAAAVAVAVGATGSAAVVLSVVGNQGDSPDPVVMAARVAAPVDTAPPVGAQAHPPASAATPRPASAPSAAPPVIPPSEDAQRSDPPAQPAGPPAKLADADISAAPAAGPAVPTEDTPHATAHPSRNAGLHRRYAPWGPQAFRRFAHSFFATFQNRRSW
jgi:hypothetical protein